MNVEIDKYSGFCFGVVYAISVAEEELNKSGHLYCLGEIVHNDIEVDRLRAKGLEIIDNEKLKDIKNCKVLIRAHGEPPETYRIALNNNIELIDASCPVVLKLQNRIRQGYLHACADQGQIVIFGKKGHAEVVGLEGQTGNDAIVVNSLEDLDKIDYNRPIYFYSQTTQSTDDYKVFVEEIKKRMPLQHDHSDLYANDTICRQVSNRTPKLTEFARKFDVIIFVSGKNSSNGKYLFKVCQTANARSYIVETETDIDNSWFENAQSVGVSGATSTPMWLMEEIAERIKLIK